MAISVQYGGWEASCLYFDPPHPGPPPSADPGPDLFCVRKIFRMLYAFTVIRNYLMGMNKLFPAIVNISSFSRGC